jgi:hypothetical protein
VLETMQNLKLVGNICQHGAKLSLAFLLGKSELPKGGRN